MRVVTLVFLGSVVPAALAAQTYLLVIVGVGGGERYRNRFHEWGRAMVVAATERFGLDSEHVIYLGERPRMDPLISGKATRENVTAALEKLADSTPAQAEIFIVLVGHGSFRDGVSKFNLPGPDLSAREFAGLVARFGSRTVTFVDLSSASGGFIEKLAGARRIVVTATKSGYERNETHFGGYFVNAYSDDVADLDKDNRVSVLEAFQYASQQVNRYYEDEKLLKSEHAVLEDNGDGEGSETPGIDASDGSLAAVAFLLRSRTVVAGKEEAPADKELRALELGRLDLERKIAELRRLKTSKGQAEYENQLESLLLELATVSRKIRKLRGGGT